MPATSKKQEKFMQAVAHNPQFAKKVGVPQKVGKEFTMKKYSEGGMMKKEGRGMAKADMQKVAKKEVKSHEKAMHGAKKMMGGGMTYKKGGGVDGCAVKGKTKGTMVKMAKGGKTC